MHGFVGLVCFHVALSSESSIGSPKYFSITYTDSAAGTTMRIYDVVINPALADSMFQPNN